MSALLLLRNKSTKFREFYREVYTHEDNSFEISEQINTEQPRADSFFQAVSRATASATCTNNNMFSSSFVHSTNFTKVSLNILQKIAKSSGEQIPCFLNGCVSHHERLTSTAQEQVKKVSPIL